MSSISKFIRKVEPTQAIAPVGNIPPERQWAIGGIYPTGNIHPANNKPTYIKIIQDNLSNYDKTTIGSGEPTGLTNVETISVMKFEFIRDDDVVYTQAATWDNTDTSECRIWCNANGLEYFRSVNDTTVWRDGSAKLILYLEFTKTTDSPVV